MRLFEPAYRAALDTIDSALIAISATGHVLFANRAGETVLRDAEWLKTANGVLTAGTAVSTHALLGSVLHRACEGVGARLLLNDSCTGAEVVLSTAPVPSSRAPDERSVALIWLTKTVPQQNAARLCAQLFNLTLTEERLLARLIFEDELRDAAALLNISIHTARSHLKSIFRKTGRRSQGKLLMMIGQLAAIRPPP